MKLAPGIALFGLLLAAPAWAADTSLMPLPPTKKECIRLVPGAAASPVYPEALYARKRGGAVKLEMEFSGPESAPRVKVLANSGDTLLEEAATNFVRQYRNVCTPEEGPMRVEQEFVFEPNDGRKVVWTIAAGFKDRYSGISKRCLAHLGPDAKPFYPRSAVRSNLSGRVLMQVTFDELDKPPRVSFVVPGPTFAGFERAVTEFAEGYRMTCGDTPATAIQWFNFFIEGTPGTVLRDASLTTFLRSSKNATATPVYFDLTTMSCPFDVRLEYWQPLYRNRVGEVGEAVAARRPFLDWLSSLQLDIKDRDFNSVVGDSLTITVPCGKIDL